MLVVNFGGGRFRRGRLLFDSLGRLILLGGCSCGSSRWFDRLGWFGRLDYRFGDYLGLGHSGAVKLTGKSIRIDEIGFGDLQMEGNRLSVFH